MALLTKQTTANALLSILANRSVHTQRNFSPKLSGATPPDEVPWACRWWNPDGGVSVYIPELGAVMGETLPLDRSELTASKTDETAGVEPVDWYNAPRGQSSVPDSESVYAIFTRATADAPLKVALLLAPETPDESAYENLVAIVHLATLTHLERDKIPETHVAQLVVGALSFGGAPEPHFDFPWRVKYSDTDTSWVIFIPDGSIVNEPTIDVSGLTAAVDSGWYKIASGSSSAETATASDVYAVLTRSDESSPVTASVAYTTSRPENDEALAIVHVAHLTVTIDAENPEAPPVRTVSQRVVGALSFGGASTPATPFVAAFVVRKRTKGEETSSGTTESDIYEIYSPVWYSRRKYYTGGTLNGWTDITAVASGTLYAVLRAEYDYETGELDDAELFITNDTSQYTDVELDPGDRYGGTNGIIHYFVPIARFWSDGTFDQTHVGVIVEDVSDKYTTPSEIFIPGALDLQTVSSKLCLVQYWDKIAVGATGVITITPNVANSDYSSSDSGGINRSSQYASRIPLLTHADEHASGVVAHNG